MRFSAISAGVILASIGAASAQTYATSEQPFPTAPQGYQAFEPNTFNAEGYQAATQPLPQAPLAQPPLVAGEVVYETMPYAGSPEVAQPLPFAPAQPVTGGVVYEGAPNDPSLGDNLSRPLGAPETFAAQQSEPRGELGFSQETETSRLLLALEKTYASRVSEMKVKHLAQRRAMLDAFEREAADPDKVLGLAGRMRTGLAELEAVQKASLAEEERQYMAAMLSVLDTAPSRVE